MSQLYDLNGEWVDIVRFRKAKGIQQSIEKEPEVIEIKNEEVKIVEPEIKLEIKEEIKKPTKAISKNKKK